MENGDGLLGIKSKARSFFFFFGYKKLKAFSLKFET